MAVHPSDLAPALLAFDADVRLRGRNGERALAAFALVGVAAVLRLSPERRVGHARVVLSGVAPIPWRARAAERVLFGAEMSESLLESAAHAALEGAVPLRRNAYKIPLLRALVRRAFKALL